MLRTVASTTIWPRNYFEVDVPKYILDRDGLLAVEPHISRAFGVPSILHSVVNTIRIENTGCNPVSLRKHEYFCQVRSVYIPLTDPEPVSSHTDTKNALKPMSSYLIHTHHRSQLIQMTGKLFRLKKIPLPEMTQYLALSHKDIMVRQDHSKLKITLASNASTEKGAATSIFS